MTDKNEVMPFWAEFRTSPEYNSVNTYPEQSVKTTVEAFGAMMASMTSTPMKQWQVSDLQPVLEDLVETATNDTDPEAGNVLTGTYDSIRAMLRYLASQQEIGMTRAQLNDMLDKFEAANGLEGEEMAEDTNDYQKNRDINDDPELAAWQEHTARDIDRYTVEWVNAYVASPAWQTRSTEVTPEFLTTTFKMLAQNIYDQYRKTPKAWTKKAIVGVMTGNFVSNVGFREAEYEMLAPAFSDLLAYLGKEGLLNSKRASDYQRFITAAAPEMIEMSKDSDNFSPSKKMATEMMAAGVDLTDQAAVQAYMAKKMGKSQPEPSQAELDAAMANPAALVDLATKYDPDPDKKYLSVQRVPDHDGLQWRQKTAIAVHTQGVISGLQLWAMRDTYQLPGNWGAHDVIKNMSEVIDVMYAQNLETPADWSVATWENFGNWMRDSQSKKRYDENIQMLESLMALLTKGGILSAQQGQQLPAAVRGDAIPEVAGPTKVKGNVISMKKARKLLKAMKHR